MVKLYEQVSIILNSTLTSPKTRRKIHTKSYVDLKRKGIDLIYQRYLTMKTLNLIKTTSFDLESDTFKRNSGSYVEITNRKRLITH